MRFSVTNQPGEMHLSDVCFEVQSQLFQILNPDENLILVCTYHNETQRGLRMTVCEVFYKRKIIRKRRVLWRKKKCNAFGW